MDQLHRRQPTNLASAETGLSLGMDGKPILSIGDKQFRANQIRTEQGELGNLVSVHVTEAVEGQYTSATVLIPTVDLGNDKSQPLKMMIVSKHLGVIHPGKHGALQDYTVTMLKGTASHIEPLSGATRG